MNALLRFPLAAALLGACAPSRTASWRSTRTR